MGTASHAIWYWAGAVLKCNACSSILPTLAAQQRAIHGLRAKHYAKQVADGPEIISVSHAVAGGEGDGHGTDGFGKRQDPELQIIRA